MAINLGLSYPWIILRLKAVWYALEMTRADILYARTAHDPVCPAQIP